MRAQCRIAFDAPRSLIAMVVGYRIVVVRSVIVVSRKGQRYTVEVRYCGIVETNMMPLHYGAFALGRASCVRRGAEDAQRAATHQPGH